MSSVMIRTIAYIITTVVVVGVMGFLIYLIYRSVNKTNIKSQTIQRGFNIASLLGSQKNITVCPKKMEGCDFVGLAGLVNATKQASSSAVITLASGDYTDDPITLSTKDAPINSIVIRGEAFNTVNISSNSNIGDILKIVGAKEVTLENITLKTEKGQNSLRIDQSQQITLKRIKFINGGALITQSKNVKIQESVFNKASISVHDKTEAEIYDNLIIHGRDDKAFNGILVIQSQANIHNNTIYRTYHGILCQSPSTCVISQNIFSENINAVKIDKSELSNNIFWNNVNQPPPTLLSGTNKELDPQFQDPQHDNFRLKDGSPAKTGGGDNTLIGVFGNKEIGSRYHPEVTPSPTLNENTSSPSSTLSPKTNISPSVSPDSSQLTRSISSTPFIKPTSSTLATPTISPLSPTLPPPTQGEKSCYDFFALPGHKFAPGCRPCTCDGRRYSQFNCKDCISGYSFCYGGYCMSE